MRAVEHDRAVWKGAVAGLAGGLAGSWAMNQFQSAWSKASRILAADRTVQSATPHGAQQPSEDDATMRAADAISRAVFGRALTREEKQRAGPWVHYAFGSAAGAMYGAAAELAPRTTATRGAAFGSAVWLGADEIGVPALGLSRPSRDYPVSTHVSALAAHLVYGLASDLIRRRVRAVL